ncbi:MAG TPA: ABC transporter permease [Longimicrobiaceae bacterium]|nr:ABC transporter permease [Longimicrobiaceae bacterium]
MVRIPGIRRVFRFPSAEGRVAGEVEDEIEFHLEERARELVARGMDPAAARAEALREFGDVREARTALEEIGRRRVRRARRTGWWSDLRQDVRYGARALLRSPGFTLVAVLTLALGIGATTAIYTVVDTVLLRPLGVADPDRLVVLRERNRGDETSPLRQGGTVSPANFFDWEAQARSFSSLAYFTQWPLNLTGDGEPQEVQVQAASADLFSTLGVRPMLGRTFRPEEDDPEGEGIGFGGVAVLSHRLWQSRYGGDPDVLGKTIRVADLPLEVVGVMGPDFRMLGHRPDLWMPLAIQPGNRTDMGRFLTAVGRLKPGIPLERAEEEMGAIARRLEEAYPDQNTGMGVTLMPAREQVVGEVRPALLVLLAAVGMLLLIACTNVANLLLGRATARRQEIAVRLSLGATRARLVRQLLTESLVLSAVGGAIGLAAAALGTRVLVRSLPESVQLPQMEAVAVDARVLAFALGVTLLTGILFGLAPALVSSRTDLQGSLRDGGRGSTGGRAPMRLRGALVVAEVALALMLLVGAGLLLRSFQKLQAVDTGMNPAGVLTLRMSLGSEAYGSADAQRGFLARLLPALEALPGVQAVGTTSHLPLTEEGKMGHNAFRADRPRPVQGRATSVDFRVAGGDYFRAQGVRLVRGRTFGPRDDPGAPTVFVINESLARTLFPGEDPVGKRLAYPWFEGDVEGEIVGVVEDVRETSVAAEPAPALYRAFAQMPDADLVVMIRTAGDPLALAGAAREAIRRLDPDLPVASVRTMASVVAGATARPRLSSYLLGGFAAVALLMAAIGLYGVIAYGVAQRRGEIGVRVALGADRAAILGLIVRQGMALTAAGLAVGLIGALALSRLLRSLLYGVTTTDAATFLAVPLVLAAVALLASYLPASRAARTDPATALRLQ